MIKIKKIFLDGCGPCIASEEILKDYENVERIDVTAREKLEEYNGKYGLTKVPTLIFVDDSDDKELELARLEVDFTKEDINGILNKLNK